MNLSTRSTKKLPTPSYIPPFLPPQTSQSHTSTTFTDLVSHGRKSLFRQFHTTNSKNSLSLFWNPSFDIPSPLPPPKKKPPPKTCAHYLPVTFLPTNIESAHLRSPLLLPQPNRRLFSFKTRCLLRTDTQDCHKKFPLYKYWWDSKRLPFPRVGCLASTVLQTWNLIKPYEPLESSPSPWSSSIYSRRVPICIH